jgi:hypothetical protein
MEAFGMSLEQTQEKLFDYQLNEQLHEDETGKWRKT